MTRVNFLNIVDEFTGSTEMTAPLVLRNRHHLR
jgi:hypothetical protein